MRSSVSVAIIGSGIAGTTLARLLTDDIPSAEVTIFEKSRGVGGRMATRYSEEYEFDHGAQFFTIRGGRFKKFLKRYESAFSEWPATTTTLSPDRKEYTRLWFETHYVGTPRMNSLCKKIAENIDIQVRQQILGISGTPKQRFLETEDGRFGPFDWIVSTAPAPQTQIIFNKPELSMPYSAAFALMVPVGERPDFDAAVVRDSPVSWLAVTSSKPERCQHKQLGIVAHADSQWSDERLQEPADKVKGELLDALEALAIAGLRRDCATLHLWRFSRPITAGAQPYFIDSQDKIAACGDWFVHDNVEGAFDSAYALFLTLRKQIAGQIAGSKIDEDT
jgi:predicted NAD/FAD-dependent oxidoreductase